MALIEYPNLGAVQENWGVNYKTRTFESPWTGNLQVAALPWSQWTATITYSNLTREKAKKLRAFVLAMRGELNRCYLSPRHALQTFESVGSPRVFGSGQTGGSIISTGWSPDSKVAEAGDYVQIGDELKVLTFDAISDASGRSTLVFSPDLMSPPPNDSPIVLDRPACKMRLANPNQASWLVSLPEIYNLTLVFVEDSSHV